MIGIALFGLGRAGRIHSKNILANPKCVLLYAVDPSPSAIAEFKSLIPPNREEIKYINSTDDKAIKCIFEDRSVTAIFVCSTTGSHYAIAKWAIESGKAIFCEKPISVDVTETEALYRLAFEKNIPLHCSFNRRYDPQIIEMHETLNCGQMGTIHVVKTCSRDHPCPSIEFLRESGGFFHDCASHDLDMICWLIGAMPERVYVTASAHSKEIAELNDVDTAVIVLNFPPLTKNRPGPIAIVDISRHGVYGYDQRVEVLTDGGMIRSENQQADGVVLNAPSVTKSAPIKTSFPQRYYYSYLNSLECFIDTVQERKHADISACDVVNISRLAHLCEKSFKDGQPHEFRPTKLDF
ncbi:unnamed protein product [Rodentolepis nana]|uniref:Oxidoreductase yrbE n=1 Tax=Rodentolepis nana TaxID=102285 RepID=A0A0R3TRC4_RODNA|nr:unnamed protein product [Rodentolepis nana]